MRAKDKWSKYLLLKRSRHLTHYMPETRWMTRKAFWRMLSKYGQVILKPVNGSGGAGVIKVSSLGNHYYHIHSENRKVMVKGKDMMFHNLISKMRSLAYMVQRYIPLAKINNRPFDMRFIVQRKRDSNHWNITAKAAKVAGKGYIVTNNTRSKGKMMHVRAALKKSSLKGRSHRMILSNLNSVALMSAYRLMAAFPAHRIYGMDMGLDKNGRLWIIETNHFPAISHFRKLGNKAMIRRIRAYKYG
ncbi:YheC/YheD family protein [Brevibacillus ginsengisoli]|uniref:YheC/YheD family protein n=1 Tax=Brevibacillus ginsengisoli TaxID=363854 RepID=UPI003CEC555A